MTLTFGVRLTIGNDLRNQTTVYFGLYYEPSRNDYEEYAKYGGWNNALELLSCDYDEGDEEIEIIKEQLESDNSYCLDIYLDKRSHKLFEEFLVEKYQEKVERYLRDKIEIDLDKDLNDILNYC